MYRLNVYSTSMCVIDTTCDVVWGRLSIDRPFIVVMYHLYISNSYYVYILLIENVVTKGLKSNYISQLCSKNLAES